VRSDTRASLAAVQTYREAWLALFAGIARDTGLHIVAGSFLVEVGGGRYRNRSDLFSPDGGHGWQEKLQLTGFEKTTGVIEPGDALKVFDLGGVRACIAICYDIEFPLPVRTQWEAGARLLLVPSCTDTAAGATRVRTGCLARAGEPLFRRAIGDRRRGAVDTGARRQHRHGRPVRTDGCGLPRRRCAGRQRRHRCVRDRRSRSRGAGERACGRAGG